MTDDAMFDLADRIEAHLTSTPQTPSAIGRRAKLTTGQVHQGLAWMVRERYAVAVGNGGWRRYRTRNFGET